MYSIIKKALFLFEPEKAHHIAGAGLKLVPKIPLLKTLLKKQYFITDDMLKQDIFGITFKNPVGIGAGFDKNGEYIEGMSSMGFGFTEIGTVTPKPQEGNAKPRLFRLKEEQSIQNAMGFNNFGKDYMLSKLDNLPQDINYPIGINIGKNKNTTEDDALNDYKILFEAFKDYGDYVVINISSPNTPNLRDLQNEQFINDIFSMAKKITKKPILLKIAPDMSVENAINLCQMAIDSGADGIIATNTTIDYALTPNAKDFGGISGKLLKEKSYELFRAIGEKFYDKTILISVGGIDSPEEAYKRIKAGASLIQVYSMLIYKGPNLIADINKELISLLKKDGYSHIKEAIGADFKWDISSHYL